MSGSNTILVLRYTVLAISVANMCHTTYQQQNCEPQLCHSGNAGDTKVVLGGFSQGAFFLVKLAQSLDPHIGHVDGVFCVATSNSELVSLEHKVALLGVSQRSRKCQAEMSSYKLQNWNYYQFFPSLQYKHLTINFSVELVKGK